MKRSRLVLSLVVAGWLAPYGRRRRGGQGRCRDSRLQDRERRRRQPELDRLGHAQQPDDVVGRVLPRQVPERPHPDRRQGLLDGAAGADRRHRADRSDEPRHEASEIDAFEKKFGYAPTAYKVAVDALAVYVNKDNPLEKLTLPQVDALFSKARRCGAPSTLAQWSQLGLTGMYAGRRISLYGRNSASGTYGYFKEHALCGGDFATT